MTNKEFKNAHKGMPIGKTEPCHLCGDPVLVDCDYTCPQCNKIICRGCMTTQNDWKDNPITCCFMCAREIIADI